MIGCRVVIDGVRVPDGSATDDPLAPNALSGLAVTWGRETTMDQPEPATCTVDLVDRRGGTAFVSLYRVGLPVTVWADTTVYPDPTVPVFTDPTFSTTAPGATPASVVASGGQVAAVAGGGVKLTPARSSRRVQVDTAPAPFDPVNPAAWDLIPAVLPGQTWRVDATVGLPGYAGATVQAVIFTDPADHAPTPVGPVLELLGSSELGQANDRTTTFDVTPGVAGWLGIRVVAYPPGPTWDQVDPAITWDQVDPAITWDQVGAVFIRSLNTYAPAGGVSRSVVVFAGVITDLSAVFDQDEGAAQVSVTAADFTSALANRNVGDEPWTVEPMASRFARVLTLAGSAVTARIDPGVSTQLMSYQDVDSQGAVGLLTDYAVSVDGVLWSAFHATTGAYLWVEDVAARRSGRVLAMRSGVVTIAQSGAGRLQLSACDVLLDPVTWTQDTADVATRTAVTWLEQGVDDQGQPDTTERTVTVVNPALEDVMGTRRVSVSTLLVSSSDATTVADRIMGRAGRATDWRATDLTWELADTEDTPANATRALELLDGTTRIGAPVSLTDLPDWSPVSGDQSVFLEGGTYGFTDGAWVLAMTVSRAVGLGGSATWDELDPTWTWDQVDPTITWDDLRGVGVEGVSETIGAGPALTLSPAPAGVRKTEGS